MDEIPKTVADPVTNYVFGAFCLILLATLIWFIRQYIRALSTIVSDALKTLGEVKQALEANTRVIQRLYDHETARIPEP